jgi:hypothetical protein
MITSKRVRWAGNIARVKEERNKIGFWWRKDEGK